MHEAKSIANSRPRRRSTRIVIAAALAMLTVLMVVFSILLIRFVAEIGDLSQAGERATADAIVVLTGDRARISRAIELLREGKGERLLITGVNEHTSRAAIRKMIANAGPKFDCCVDIDRAALDTIGNARQAGIWAQQRGFRSLLVVTSDYHLPRSLVEFRRAAPEISIHPVSANSGENEILQSRNRLRILTQEFIKYLATRLHLGNRQRSPESEVPAL